MYRVPLNHGVLPENILVAANFQVLRSYRSYRILPLFILSMLLHLVPNALLHPEPERGG